MMDGEVFDHKGLIYGMGHAVYSLSDPRERIFRGYVEKLSVAKKRDNEMNLYNTIEKVAPETVSYTHLDVYKRQLLPRASFSSSRFTNGSSSMRNGFSPGYIASTSAKRIHMPIRSL